jgi:hypothetical protein
MDKNSIFIIISFIFILAWIMTKDNKVYIVNNKVKNNKINTSKIIEPTNTSVHSAPYELYMGVHKYLKDNQQNTCNNGTNTLTKISEECVHNVVKQIGCYDCAIKECKMETISEKQRCNV